MNNFSFPNFLKYWLPLIVYCFFIYILSEKGGKITLPPLPFVDKILHILLYSILGFLYSRAHNFQWNKFTFLATVLFAVLYGISDELHQYFVPQRNSSIMDVVADGLGGMFGYFFYNLTRSYQTGYNE